MLKPDERNKETVEWVNNFKQISRCNTCDNYRVNSNIDPQPKSTSCVPSKSFVNKFDRLCVCGNDAREIEAYVPADDVFKLVPPPEWCPLTSQKEISIPKKEIESIHKMIKDVDRVLSVNFDTMKPNLLVESLHEYHCDMLDTFVEMVRNVNSKFEYLAGL